MCLKVLQTLACIDPCSNFSAVLSVLFCTRQTDRLRFVVTHAPAGCVLACLPFPSSSQKKQQIIVWLGLTHKQNGGFMTQCIDLYSSSFVQNRRLPWF